MLETLGARSGGALPHGRAWPDESSAPRCARFQIWTSLSRWFLGGRRAARSHGRRLTTPLAAAGILESSSSACQPPLGAGQRRTPPLTGVDLPPNQRRAANLQCSRRTRREMECRFFARQQVRPPAVRSASRIRIKLPSRSKCTRADCRDPLSASASCVSQLALQVGSSALVRWLQLQIGVPSCPDERDRP